MEGRGGVRFCDVFQRHPPRLITPALGKESTLQLAKKLGIGARQSFENLHFLEIVTFEPEVMSPYENMEGI